MLRLALFTALTLAFLISPAEVFSQKKDNGNGDIIKAGPQQYAMLFQFREFIGEVRSMDKNSVHIRVNYNHAVRNQNNNNNNNNRGKGKNNNRPQFHIERDYIDFDLPFSGSIPLRRLKPAAATTFDDKGNPVTVKPDPKDKLPGFPATADEFRVGTDVKVTLAAPRPGGDRPQVAMLMILADAPMNDSKKKK